jgi:hypothetical protein
MRRLISVLVAAAALGGLCSPAMGAPLTPDQRQAIADWKAMHPGMPFPIEAPRGPEPGAPAVPAPSVRDGALDTAECNGLMQWRAPVSKRDDAFFAPSANTYLTCFNPLIFYSCQVNLYGLYKVHFIPLDTKGVSIGVPGLGCTARAEMDPDVLNSVSYHADFRYSFTRFDGSVWSQADSGRRICTKGIGTPTILCTEEIFWGWYEFGTGYLY